MKYLLIAVACMAVGQCNGAPRSPPQPLHCYQWWVQTDLPTHTWREVPC